MNTPIYMEKVNHPITFEINGEDPDDDVWPPAEQRGVVILNGGQDKITPNSRNPFEQEWTMESIHESIRACRERGLIPGAIVAARPLLGSGNDWKVKSYVYWGIITSLNTYIPGQVYTAYAPITLRWFVPDNHMNKAVDRVFPVDLYLIHAALTDDAVEAKMRAQL